MKQNKERVSSFLMLIHSGVMCLSLGLRLLKDWEKCHEMDPFKISRGFAGLFVVGTRMFPTNSLKANGAH